MDAQPAECDNQVVWQDLAIRMPAAWEMSRYGLRYERGLCVFADEFRDRLHLAWQRAVDGPDVERLLSDLKAREQAAPPANSSGSQAPAFVSLPAIGAWHGLTISRGDDVTTRAVCNIAPHRLLIEATLLWERAWDKQLEREILASMHMRDTSAWRRWQAFGICAEIPAELALTECRCLPGDVQWSFQSQGRYPSVSVRRLGFVRAWLKQPLNRWLEQQIPPGATKVRQGALHPLASHEVATIASRRRREGLGLLTGARIHRHDWAALCPREQRLYHVATESRDEAPELVRLACACGSLLPGMTQGGDP